MSKNKLDFYYWPDYLEMHGLSGKTRSEWPFFVELEYTKRFAPIKAKELAAYCDDNDEQWVRTVWMYAEFLNED